MLRRRALLSALVVTLAAALVAGCGSGTGVRVYQGSPHNLEVENQSFTETCGVRVDGALVGTLQPRSEGFFDIVPGTRTVDLIHHGTGLVERAGTFTFTDTSLVHIVFD